MEITKRKYITTITYDKICNGVKNSCRESFFDKKYVDIRVDEINNCEYDKEYKIDQNTLFLDFIDIYLKKVSLKKDTYKKYARVMIGHRAFTLGARDIASDILFGVMETSEIKLVEDVGLSPSDFENVEEIQEIVSQS